MAFCLPPRQSLAAFTGDAASPMIVHASFCIASGVFSLFTRFPASIGAPGSARIEWRGRHVRLKYVSSATHGFTPSPSQSSMSSATELYL